MSQSMTDSIAGECLCKGVRFELSLPAKFCAHCHCSMCRRAHGAAFVTWTGVPKGQLVVTTGAELLCRHESSPGALRTFCSRCGSSLFFEAERWAGEIHLAVANLERLPFAPSAHVFFDDHVEWVTIADDLPRLGGATGTEPL
jgi:hypothetical protein